MMEIGPRIEERLRELGLNQSDLARRAGVPQTTINSLIRGGRRSSPHLVRIAAALRTTPAYLTGEIDDPDLNATPALYSVEEEQWLDLLRGLEPQDRRAVITLTRSLASSARVATVQARKSPFRPAAVTPPETRLTA